MKLWLTNWKTGAKQAGPVRLGLDDTIEFCCLALLVCKVMFQDFICFTGSRICKPFIRIST